jgi:glycosyltransferase involved in cell wall biosynthesis
MLKLVSVIVPVYNVEDFLERCLESLIKQTYKNLEIIVVDDGATDSSGEICDKYTSIDERIIVVHKKNGGLSSARNAGLEVMSGDYFTFVDSDDFLHVKSVETWVSLLEQHNLDIVVGWFKEFYGREKINEEINFSNYELINSKEMFRMLLGEDDRITTAWGKLFDSTKFKELRFDESKLFAEDMFYFEDVFSDNWRIGFDKNIFYYYSQEGVSLVRSKYNIKKLNRLVAAKKWFALIQNKYNDLYELAFGYYYKLVINEFSNLLFYNDVNPNEYIDRYINEINKDYHLILKSNYINWRDKTKVFFIRNRYFNVYRTIRKIVGSLK